MKLKVRDMKEILCEIDVDSEERVHYLIQWLEAWSRDKVLMLVYKARIIPCDSLLRDNGILDGSSILVFFKKVYPLDPEEQLLLITLMSLLNTLLQSRESLLLVEALDNNVLDQISDIVQKSIDPILLEKAMIFGLAVFELYEEDGSTHLNSLFKMAKRALELPQEDNYTVLGAILISKVFNIQNDFAREVSTDFGFLQSMLDLLDQSPGRDCILVILAHVVSHIIEEEMSEAHLHPYIKCLLKNVDVIERIVRFYQSQPPLESILWDYQESIMSWIYRMLHKWIAESSEDCDVSASDINRLLHLAAMELH